MRGFKNLTKKFFKMFQILTKLKINCLSYKFNKSGFFKVRRQPQGFKKLSKNFLRCFKFINYFKNPGSIYLNPSNY